MATPHHVLDAAIRAIQGESNMDMDVVHSILVDPRVTSFVALAPGTDRIVRVIAALSIGYISLFDEQTINDPDIQNAVARMIGTDEGDRILSWWSKIAPAEWGQTHANALIQAAKDGTCDPRVAARLIGPCDMSAELLRAPDHVVSAICSWGQSTPDAPTAWMQALSPKELNRLLNAIHLYPAVAERCLPWLPSGMANRMRIKSRNAFDIGTALDAFTAASPIARDQHADLIQDLVMNAEPGHLGTLTYLACATGAEYIWRRVADLLKKNSDTVTSVVIEASWKGLPEHVRQVILDNVGKSNACAAIAAAQGHDVSVRIDATAVPAFFATIDPKVWDNLLPETQRLWLQELEVNTAPLAVRSLGLRPELLSHATIGNFLAYGGYRRAHDAETLRWTQLALALRDVPFDVTYKLIAALPTLPPDPGTFFFIASKSGDLNSIAHARNALRTPSDLACAVALHRCVNNHYELMSTCNEELQRALHGRTWHDLEEKIIPVLDRTVRAALLPDADAMAERLASPDRQEEMRTAIQRLARLSPAIAIPARLALNRWGQDDLFSSESTTIATVLRDHGDVYLAIADALTHDRRAVLLPSSSDPHQNDALRALARDDPPTAQSLAYAIQAKDRLAVMHALLTAPPRHAAAVWRTLTDLGFNPTGAAFVAADQEGGRDTVAELALSIIRSNGVYLRGACVTALAARPAFLRQIWNELPDDVRQDVQRLIESRSDVHRTKSICRTR